jgi:hypothetical protein
MYKFNYIFIKTTGRIFFVVVVVVVFLKERKDLYFTGYWECSFPFSFNLLRQVQ